MLMLIGLLYMAFAAVASAAAAITVLLSVFAFRIAELRKPALLAALSGLVGAAVSMGVHFLVIATILFGEAGSKTGLPWLLWAVIGFGLASLPVFGISVAGTGVWRRIRQTAA